MYRGGGVTTDGKSLYVVTHRNHSVFKVEISGEKTHIAGSHGQSGCSDGLGNSAKFTYPSFITTDGKKLYVVSSTNQVIRQIH